MARKIKRFKAIALNKRTGDRASYVIGRVDPSGHCPRIIYKPNEWSKARPEMARKGYHILVFRTFDQAKQFLGFAAFRGANNINDPVYSQEIWECECEERVELPNMFEVYSAKFWMVTRLRDLIKRWGGYGRAWPSGTQMFKRVKLTKRVFPSSETDQ